MQNDDIERKRKELELSLANQHHMTDRSKYELIRKIMDLLEDAMEEDKDVSWFYEDGDLCMEPCRCL